MKKKMFLSLILCVSLFSCAKDELMPSEREDGKIEIKTLIISEGEGGIITKTETTAGKTTGSGLYAKLEQCVVKAIPNTGYTLDKFEGSNKKKTFSGSDTYDFPVEMTTTFTASFKKTESPGFYNLKVNDPSLGSVQPKVEFNTKDWSVNDAVNLSASTPLNLQAGVTVTGINVTLPDGTTYDFLGAMENMRTSYMSAAKINQEKSITFYKGMLMDLAQSKDDYTQDMGLGAQDWFNLGNYAYESFLANNNPSFPDGTTFTIILSKSSTPVIPGANQGVITLTANGSGKVSLDGVNWSTSLSKTYNIGDNCTVWAAGNYTTSTDGNEYDAFIGFDGLWTNTWTDNGNITSSGNYSFTVTGNRSVTATFRHERYVGSQNGM